LKTTDRRFFDFGSISVHHESVRSSARDMVLLFAALLVASQGVIVSIPHDHADGAVPQEELACSASHPSSETEHLHGSGRLLAPHACVACLAGSTAGESLGVVSIDGAPESGPCVVTDANEMRLRDRARLPFLRGPPRPV
jgi:hypothetical protein